MSEQGNQYGFYFNQARCHGCQTCAIVCKTWNNLPAGPQKWLKFFRWYTGTFPKIRMNNLFAPCYHCQNPVCVDAAGGAMFKEPKYGAVLIDPDKAADPLMRAAWNACPYGAIVFDSNSPTAKASMCNMCIDRLEQDKLPICVASCQERALDFGKLSDLQAKYGTNAQLEGMPDPSTVRPAVVFKPMDPQKELVPYDAATALQLLATSPVGAKIYNSASDVANVPAGVVKRNKLVMKPNSVEELMYYTGYDND